MVVRQLVARQSDATENLPYLREAQDDGQLLLGAGRTRLKVRNLFPAYAQRKT